MSIDEILALLSAVHHTGPYRYEAVCPAHEDSASSLHVHAIQNGEISVWCRVGCTLSAVLDSLGLPAAALRPQSGSEGHGKGAPR